MRRLTAAATIAVMASSAAAQDRMTRTVCQDMFDRAARLADPDAEGAGLDQRLGAILVTPDNWCIIRRDMDGFSDVAFSTFEWRADEADRWTNQGIPPLALHLRIGGLDPDEMEDSAPTTRPDVTFEATLRQNPQAGQVLIERAVMFNDAGDSLAVSGVFERVFLSSPSMMQVSMGSATFKAGLLTMTLDGTHENPFGFYLDVEIDGTPKSQRDAAFDLISRLPRGVVDDAARAELTAYAGDLPKPVGTLEVSVGSERGLGLMQVGMAMYSSFASIVDETASSNEMEILFDGVTVNADWTPAAQMAD